MRRLILCSIVLFFSGCSILSKPEARQTTRYQLGLAATASQAASATMSVAAVACDRVLRIQNVEAAPPYAGDDLLYSETPQVISSYAWHRWATPPATMLTSDLLATISRAKLYRSVLGPTDPGQADLLLAVRINEGPIQVFSGGNGADRQSVERLSYTATLTNANSGAVIGTRLFSTSHKAEPNPYGGVQAANTMVRRMNSDMLAWLSSVSGVGICK